VGNGRKESEERAIEKELFLSHSLAPLFGNELLKRWSKLLADSSPHLTLPIGGSGWIGRVRRLLAVTLDGLTESHLL
jgi:hypothetical protein